MSTGCREYHTLSRRRLLGSGATAAIIAASPAWLPRVALAQSGGTRDVLITIFLRGGADGLSLCVPHGDNYYYSLRPNLAIARPDSSDPNKARNLDGFFGLAPAMVPLLEAYQANHLLFVHATGSKDSTRSHFDAMNYMEAGKPRDVNLFTGWLGRHLASSTPVNANAPLRAMGFTYGLPKTLVGGPKTLPIPYPQYFSLDGAWETGDQRKQAVSSIYSKTIDPLKTAASETMLTMQLLQAIDFEHYTPAGGAVYPDDDFGFSMKATAALIKAQTGVEAIHADFGGWDTHDNQGVIQGDLADNMSSLARSLAALHSDLLAGSSNRKFTVVVMSEFGRNVAENASGGTDHGHGNCMLLLGPNIAGGRVLRTWPGLSPEQQFEQQDLDVTIDYRDILAEIVDRRLGNSNLNVVFPDYVPTYRGVTRA